MLASQASTMDIGLLATLLGMGLIVNVLVVYIIVLARGEQKQDQEYRSPRSSQTPH